MSSTAAMEIRNLIHRLSESLSAMQEDESKKGTDATSKDSDAESSETGPKNNEPIDSLLTDNPMITKIEGSVDVRELINLLKIPEKIENDFRSAMSAIRTSEDVYLTKNQAFALAVAFDHFLTLGRSTKQKFVDKIKQQSSSN